MKIECRPDLFGELDAVGRPPDDKGLAHHVFGRDKPPLTAVGGVCGIVSQRKIVSWRFDKKAVLLGGGDPHRMNLSDGILIKDNHLAVVPLEKAIQAARVHSAYKKIEVEVESSADAVRAAEAGADIIMLDNMTPAQAKETMSALGNRGLRDKVTIEVSGGINETTIRDYAGCGVNVISMGSLTHTVRNFSLSLEILPA